MWQPMSSPKLSPIDYCVLWLLSHLYISHLHSYFVSCSVYIIIMYLDPSTSINCKYKYNIRIDPLTYPLLFFVLPFRGKGLFILSYFNVSSCVRSYFNVLHILGKKTKLVCTLY